MKKLLMVLGVIVFILSGIAIFKNQIIKYGVIRVASKLIGAPVQMDHLSLNILSSTIRISGFKIYNPSGFPEGILVSCPEMNVIYDRSDLFKRKFHFLVAEIKIEEVGLTKNKEGKLNVDSLKVVQEEGKTGKQKSKPIPLQIDFLTLNIGKVVYKDYTNSEEPGIQVHDVNIHKTFKNITSAQQLTVLLLAEPLMVAGIKGAIKNALIYKVAMLAGVEVLPVVFAVKFFGKSSVKETIEQSFEHVYEASLNVIKRMGKIIKDDATHGLIKAKINGTNVTLRLKKREEHKTEITIIARKYFLPQPNIAGGVLYQINEKLE